MKWIKILFAVFFTILCFAFSAQAEEIYDEQHSAVDTDSIYNALTDEAKDFLDSFGVDFSESDWYEGITYKSVFERIIDIFKGSLKEPLKCSVSAAAILLLSAAVKSLAGEKEELNYAVNIISVLGLCICLGIPVCSLIVSVNGALKGSSVFMLAFVPVFCGILLLSGFAAVSATSSGILLFAAETVGAASSFVIAPAVSSCLALGISSAISPFGGAKKTVEILKKAVIWGLSTVSAVFSAVLSAGAALGSASDKLTLKTAKLFTSSVVPVVGGAISESLSAVAASFSLLKTSVGLMGVVGIAAIFLPIIIEISVFKFCSLAVEIFASLLGLEEPALVVRSVSGALTLMIAVSLLIALLIIISLAVLIKVGGAV